jgi:diguanylate cyclase
VTIIVSDNGIGITAQALPRVFELFVQDEHAAAANGGGLGIGLAVVRELVEAHGGNVVAASAGKDLGSQFVVTLPLVPAIATPQ